MKIHWATIKKAKNVFAIAISVGKERGDEKILTICTDKIAEIPAGMFAQKNIFPNLAGGMNLSRACLTPVYEIVSLRIENVIK